MKKIITKTALITLFGLTIMGCEKDNNNLNFLEGYIVGFDPCTINHHYRIGYVIISTDTKDTLVTYNLSDYVFNMPASVLLNPLDTLYKIPESNFLNYRNSAYFPLDVRYEYKIIVTYIYATEDKRIFNLCTTDINQGDFSYQILHNQVLIKSATK
jgi:hypothetical protein